MRPCSARRRRSRPIASLDALAAHVDLTKLSRAPGRFDVEELRSLNAKLLHMLPFEAVAPRLAAAGITGLPSCGRPCAATSRRSATCAPGSRLSTARLAPHIEDAATCATAASLLPPEPWTADTWSAWTTAIREATGLKGKALFHPLRLALTGREAGPEMRALLPLIGRARAEARLNGRTA